MARPRKNAAKAQGSLMKPDGVQEDVIPVEEQPYPLPDGWKWVRLGDYNCYAGQTVNPELFPENTFELYSVPSSSFDYPEIISGKEIGSSKQSVEPDDVLLCKINPRINRVWQVTGYTNHRLIASSEWIIFRNKNILSKYMIYCMRSKYFREYMLSNISGVGGSLMRAQPKHVRLYPIPLPPFDEQQRIVDRIESLFAKLDEAREKAEAVLDGFESRKAAILHKAFTGELTHTSPISFLSITNFIKKEKNALKAGPFGSALKKDFYVPSGYKIYGQEQVIAGDETIGNYYINEEKYLELIACKVAPGDVLISLVGTVGKVLVLSENCKPGIINPRLIKITLDQSKIYPKLFSYYFQSDETKASYKESSHGTTMDVLNMGILKQLKFPCFSLPQQREIIRILDSLLAKEQQVKEAAENVLNQIDLMKKAILAKAFRGELTGQVHNSKQR